MSETITPRRRAVELPVAALAGAAAGLLAGWLVFGRAPAEPPGSGVHARPVLTQPVDPRAEIARLSESVEALSESVRRLAAAEVERLKAPAPAPVDEGPPPPRIAPGVKFHDTFETGTDGWFVARFAPMIIGELTRTEEEGYAKEGEGALALSYTIEPGKIPFAVRMATGINRLSLWIRAVDRPADVLVGAQERDESSYQHMLHLEPAEGWKRLDLDLAQFVLGDDSTDENGRLDFHEIRSVSVVDASGFLGGEGDNVLLIDDVTGEYREAEPAEEGERERF